MVTELNHVAIIDRIIAIFQADASLYTATGTKIRSFTNGVPVEPLPYPYCYIAFEGEDDRPLEAVTASGSFIIATTSYHKWTYRIVIVANLKTSEKSEQDFLNWIKLIKERLKSNVKLGVAADGTDPLIKISHPIKTATKRGVDINRNAVAAAIITFQCEQSTS